LKRSIYFPLQKRVDTARIVIKPGILLGKHSGSIASVGDCVPTETA